MGSRNIIRLSTRKNQNLFYSPYLAWGDVGGFRELCGASGGHGGLWGKLWGRRRSWETARDCGRPWGATWSWEIPPRAAGDYGKPGGRWGHEEPLFETFESFCQIQLKK
jgi:hypothetical protein